MTPCQQVLEKKTGTRVLLCLKGPRTGNFEQDFFRICDQHEASEFSMTFGNSGLRTTRTAINRYFRVCSSLSTFFITPDYAVTVKQALIIRFMRVKQFVRCSQYLFVGREIHTLTIKPLIPDIYHYLPSRSRIESTNRSTLIRPEQGRCPVRGFLRSWHEIVAS